MISDIYLHHSIIELKVDEIVDDYVDPIIPDGAPIKYPNAIEPEFKDLNQAMQD